MMKKMKKIEIRSIKSIKKDNIVSFYEPIVESLIFIIIKFELSENDSRDRQVLAIASIAIDINF